MDAIGAERSRQQLPAHALYSELSLFKNYGPATACLGNAVSEVAHDDPPWEAPV